MWFRAHLLSGRKDKGLLSHSTAGKIDSPPDDSWTGSPDDSQSTHPYSKRNRKNAQAHAFD
eukprot:7763984-Pyramimonas_sp.AAC.1